MPPSRLLCLLLLPLLAVSATDDTEEDYVAEHKSSDHHLISESQPLPPDAEHELGMDLSPRMWASLFDKLSSRNDDTQDETLAKRVFCNGFTGCGGRFRGRRRQHPPALLKRPFCTHFGCANKRADAPVPPPPAKPMAPRVDMMRLPAEIRKRLFCNSFQGCRGMKRALYSNWLSKLQGIADDL